MFTYYGGVDRCGSMVLHTTRVIATPDRPKESAMAGSVESAVSPNGLTPKGRRTRQSLLDAARIVFERDGYLEARIADIAAEAGVATGTFYKYFASKAEIFRAVMVAVRPLIYDTKQQSPPNSQLTRTQRVERGIRQYIAMYRQNVTLIMLGDQAATYDPELRALRIEGRKFAAGRIQRSIERWQTEGAVDSSVDAEAVANALVSMISNQLYFSFYMKTPEFEVDRLVRTLTGIWVSALGLRD